MKHPSTYKCFKFSRGWVSALVLAALIPVMSSCGTAEPESEVAAIAGSKPNIIHIIVDELGYYEMSGMGHPQHQTPHLDQLAQEGVRFTQLLAGGSTCAPTRCSLLTGKHSGRSTVRSNRGDTPIRADEATIASVLKQAGYATGGFGKWGIGGRDSSGIPEKHGFDVFFGYYGQIHAHTYFPKYLIRNSEEVPLPGNTGDPADGPIYSHDLIFEESVKFIRENHDRPFFAYLPWTPPHGHWGFPEEDPAWPLFKDREGWPRDAKIYAAMVSQIDRQVGEIRNLLEELGIAENTLIVFTGDNGGSTYFKSKDKPHGFFSPNVDPQTGVMFRGGKRNFYEGGLRVPAIACWPGKIQPGRVSDYLGYFPDFLPTYAQLAGVDVPEEATGLSILPELLGSGEQAQHPYLYWEDHAYIAVREGDWKAVQVRRSQAWELYDLAQDISERNNIAEQHPEVLQRLQAHAKEAHQPVRPGEVYSTELIDKDRYYTEKVKRQILRQEKK